ncbi:hypothetical protein [Marinilactibacillus kalidii]|uniref:hypothetical protein n=1 Tax=Marinilactibacillus kalidii TaxID=2820274 RepID=UPI001ABE0ABB|nr:hypothetical protein [Marinilactibacillus kalidii]
MIISFIIFSTIMTIFYVFALFKMWKDDIGNRFIRIFIISEIALRYSEKSTGVVKKQIKGLITIGTILQLIVIWLYVSIVLLEPSPYSLLTLLAVFLIPLIISILAKMIFKRSEL